MRFFYSKLRELKNIFQSSFFKNILTLIKGTSIAQIISFIALPILTRFYSPEEFGYIAIYLTISQIVLSVSSGRLELAILLPEKDKYALKIAVVSCIGILITAILILILVFNFKPTIAKLFNLDDQDFILLFLPFSIIFLGFYQVAYYWHSRKKNFTNMANSRIIQSASANSVNTSLGFYGLGTTGLLIGTITGQFLSMFYIFKNLFLSLKTESKILKKNEIFSIINEYKNFPLYAMPMGFLNSVSVNILIYTFSIFYSVQLVGLYSHAFRVINYPLNFITSSFTSVFFQKLTETKYKIKLFTYSYFVNLIFATLLLLPVMFWGEIIFSYFFGEKWQYAGKIASIISPLAITSFAMRNVSNTFAVIQKNQIVLVWQILYLILSVVIIYGYSDQDIYYLLIFFTAMGSIMYLALAFIGYKTLLKEK